MERSGCSWRVGGRGQHLGATPLTGAAGCSQPGLRWLARVNQRGGDRLCGPLVLVVRSHIREGQVEAVPLGMVGCDMSGCLHCQSLLRVCWLVGSGVRHNLSQEILYGLYFVPEGILVGLL